MEKQFELRIKSFIFRVKLNLNEWYPSSPSTRHHMYRNFGNIWIGERNKLVFEQLVTEINKYQYFGCFLNSDCQLISHRMVSITENIFCLISVCVFGPFPPIISHGEIRICDIFKFKINFIATQLFQTASVSTGRRREKPFQYLHDCSAVKWHTIWKENFTNR